MLEKELKKKLFTKKREETDYINFQQMASPIKQFDPFLDRLIKGVRARMQERRKQQEAIFNRSPIQSKETAKQLIKYQKVANHILLRKFQEACSLAVSLPSQQPEDLIGENQKNREQSIFSQHNQSFNSLQSQPLRHSSSIQEQQRKFYAKPYRIHEHKRASQFSKHPQLFKALIKNLQILLEYLQSKNTKKQIKPNLEHVLPFKLKQVQFNQNTLKNQQKWLTKISKQEYVMIMERGDACLQSSTIQIHTINKENPFKIKDYLSGRDQKDVLGYILQVCKALAELIRHKIYHMDMKPRNIIPKTNLQGKIQYKLIDFEISLLLDRNKHNVHRTLREIWRLTRGYWVRKDYKIVHYLFDQMLCQKHHKVCQLFKNKIKSPCADLYDQLFVKQETSEHFVDYLMIYMECYYRNALLKIISKIMQESQWLNEHFEKLKKIIITHQPFENIDEAIYSLWSSRF